MCLVLAMSLVQGLSVWTQQKCRMNDQKLVNRTLGFDTCADLCHAEIDGLEQSGSCQLHNGSGECKCGFF